MRLDHIEESENVEDRRGEGGYDSGGGGGGFGFPGGRGGLGFGTIALLTLVGWALGINPAILIGGAEIVTGNRGGQITTQRQSAPPRQSAEEEQLRSFFGEMKTRLRAGGDFAYAYVIAHEMGHHIENLLGILPKVQQAQQRLSRREANALSVRVELMADCLAGVWAYHANQRYRVLEQGDIEEALTAAAAIGDDKLQKQAQGYVVPDSFTHGSSEQRMRWLQQGLRTGQVQACDTFNSRAL